jgi:protein phosphatase
MGSRAVWVVARDKESTRRRFGVQDGSDGAIYSRTGRRFFESAEDEAVFLEILRTVLTKTGFWEAFSTDWLCLDTELMPWSAKAQALLAEQYAPTARAGADGIAAALAALTAAVSAVPASSALPTDMTDTLNLPRLVEKFQRRAAYIERYAEAYRRYCWQTPSIADYRVAPFHILATEGKVWHTENHPHHLAAIQRYITGVDPVFIETPYIAADTEDEASLAAAADWWLSLTAGGGEGMVVKPADFIAHNNHGQLIQPAVKCRGREYLRIIYGPEYTETERLIRLRKRSLGKKRRLALDELSLGLEALERFVRKEPFHRVHQCVFGVLALENESVDPRL